VPEPNADQHPTEPRPSYGAYYYAHECGIPYERSEHWLGFFGKIADHIVRELRPKTVLDAGCAWGFLVEALRERGVEAFGVDISEHAISCVHESVRPYCRVGSLTEPIDRTFDLITCIEVIEHMSSADGRVALDNMCTATDRLLLSSSPYDYGEPTHLNVQAPEQWSALLANNNFVRELDYDLSYLTPWATLYSRKVMPIPEVVRAYDRSWWRLRLEVQETRTQLLQIQGRLEEMTAKNATSDERERLNKEVLRLRDVAVGKDAELATALGRIEELEAQLGRYVNLEQRLNDVLGSNTWRVGRAVAAPLRRLRRRSL
jgi:hypothetical protein